MTRVSVTLRRIGSFDCIDEQGKSCVVAELQFFELRSTASGKREYPGSRRFETDRGHSVRRVDARTFENVATGELLRRALPTGEEPSMRVRREL